MWPVSLFAPRELSACLSSTEDSDQEFIPGSSLPLHALAIRFFSKPLREDSPIVPHITNMTPYHHISYKPLPIRQGNSGRRQGGYLQLSGTMQTSPLRYGCMLSDSSDICHIGITLRLYLMSPYVMLKGQNSFGQASQFPPADAESSA